jgi:protein-tyrosine phosphatase
MLYDWLDQGCILQINKGSILGSFGHEVRKTAIRLLDQGMASLVASDAHGIRQRTPDLIEVHHFIGSCYSEDYANSLFIENPRRILENKDLIKPDPALRKKYKW